MAKNWMTQLDKMAGAVSGEYDPYASVIRTPSPSVNFAFGKGDGFPRGFTTVLYGPPKGGKTLLTNATIGQLHKDDPEAIVLKFDTEMRETGQMTKDDAAIWGIDRARYKCFSTNIPNEIFDAISNNVEAMCQEGAPIALIVIDSLTGIRGRRSLNSDTIDTMQIGDSALTIQEGLKQILATQRKHKIGLILTAHVRAEMDQLEQKRGNKVRMAASFGVQHHAEYFLYIEHNRNKDSREDLLGHKFESANGAGISDDKSEITGHKVRAVMKANSMGPAGRVAEFTIDYRKGIINVHEEIFLLGVNRGVITRPNLQTYRFADKDYRGKEAMLTALKDNTDLAQEVLKELRKADAEGRLVEVAQEIEESP